ncbi:hypothetical protein TNCV_2252101 [Trichonephila clavipes]|nr:hypothetical protein TNCV_2252101 [Trichonephila clavipes]
MGLKLCYSPNAQKKTTIQRLYKIHKHHDYPPIAGRLWFAKHGRLARWIVQSVPLEIVESSGHENVPTCGKPGVWSDQEDHEERGSKDHAASTCASHSDPFNDTSRRRHSNCSKNIFQTPCRSKS